MAENEAPQTETDTETDTDVQTDATDAATQTIDPAESNETDSASAPEFQQLQPDKQPPIRDADFSRFGNVHVTMTAELGRAELTLQELVALTEGSVVELNRAITAPVELVAQGVPMGKGEVVVVDEQFAIRIKEIYAS